MNPKEILTSKFQHQKSNYIIDNKLDKYIKKFIKDLNKNENIVTLYSCEGTCGLYKKQKKNSHSLYPYFGFNVNEKTWDLLWTKVIPEIMTKVSIRVSTNCYKEVIFIHWVGGTKKEFWKVIFKVFNKYFKIND